MGGPHRGRGESLPFSIVPDLGQSPEHLSKCSPGVDRTEPWAVLHDAVAGSYLANGSGVLKPEP